MMCTIRAVSIVAAHQKPSRRYVSAIFTAPRALPTYTYRLALYPQPLCPQQPQKSAHLHVYCTPPTDKKEQRDKRHDKERDSPW